MRIFRHLQNKKGGRQSRWQNAVTVVKLSDEIHFKLVQSMQWHPCHLSFYILVTGFQHAQDPQIVMYNNPKQT